VASCVSHTHPAPSLARAERFFGLVGLAASGLLLLALALAADLALTRRVAPERAAEPGGTLDFDLNLVTGDGRRIGGTPDDGLELALAPGTLYVNRPGRALPDVSINSWGLRGAEPDPAPQRPRVLVTGGSAAFGFGVADRWTFAALLQAQRRDWEVLNGGVTGYLARQELGAVVFDWIDLEPDAIVAFDGWNDVYDSYWWSLFGSGTPHPGVNVNYRFMEDRLADSWRARTDPWFALRELARSVLRGSTLLGLLADPGAAPEAPAAGDDAGWLGPTLDRYVGSLRKMRDFAGARGARLLVVLQPERSQGLAPGDRAALAARERDFFPRDRYHESFPASYARFRSRALEALARHGVEALDASAALPEGERGTKLFLDPVHLAPAGHAVIAAFLAPHLERLLAHGRHRSAPPEQSGSPAR
jgi:hypothetical protein